MSPPCSSEASVGQFPPPDGGGEAYRCSPKKSIIVSLCIFFWRGNHPERSSTPITPEHTQPSSDHISPKVPLEPLYDLLIVWGFVLFVGLRVHPNEQLSPAPMFLFQPRDFLAPVDPPRECPMVGRWKLGWRPLPPAFRAVGGGGSCPVPLGPAEGLQFFSESFFLSEFFLDPNFLCLPGPPPSRGLKRSLPGTMSPNRQCMVRKSWRSVALSFYAIPGATAACALISSTRNSRADHHNDVSGWPSRPHPAPS